MAPQPLLCRCDCNKCRKHPAGFQWQTKKLAAQHVKLYPVRWTSQNAALNRLRRSMSRNRAQPPVDPTILCRESHRLRLQRTRSIRSGQHCNGSNPAARQQRSQSNSIPRWEDFPAHPPSPEHSPEPEGPFGPVNPPEIQDLNAPMDDLPTYRPPAFQEAACVRLAYMQAVIGNVYNGLTIQQATDQLVSTLDALEVAGALPEIPRPLQTSDGAKRRLSIDPDLWITQYAICPHCWKHFSPTALRELETPECRVGNCTGLIYEDITGAKGETRRRPLKIIPQVSLIDSLRRMFLHPGFARSIRDSRGEPECLNDNDDFVMEDIHHSAAWHAQHVNITREV
ncbi:hypothetical protein PC9H_009340 [Pleurotus ostreatus]|uniref:Uncharacterized protein n=1 Tax=Pleurotus ostreatus TaxID=5322 RepID=A0A8H6ZTF8_PLEOS|nr:uncharacterized protein PC9H_009340 [Pleurotus ostreatus]KAF7424040.1 hypothetical protein PC9H_009340 [Pleurotus ostreatus]